MTSDDANVSGAVYNFGEDVGIVYITTGAEAGESFNVTVAVTVGEDDTETLVIPCTSIASPAIKAVTENQGATEISNKLTMAVNDTARLYLAGLDGIDPDDIVVSLPRGTAELTVGENGYGYADITLGNQYLVGDVNILLAVGKVFDPHGSYTKQYAIALNGVGVIKEPASLNIVDRYYSQVAGQGCTVTDSTASYGSIKAVDNTTTLGVAIKDSSNVDASSHFTVIADPTIATGGFSISQKSGADAPTPGEYTITLTSNYDFYAEAKFSVYVPSPI